MKWIAISAYIGTIVAANWAVATFGLIPVGFGLLAPAGVLFVGLTLGLRDAVQEYFGKTISLGAVAVGCVLSALLAGPAFALASFAAFMISETLDMAVYTPLRDRGRILLAILASNTVGLVADSVAFLYLAFGSLEFLAGQIVGKFEMTLLTVAVVWLWRSQIMRVAAAPRR